MKRMVDIFFFAISVLLIAVEVIFAQHEIESSNNHLMQPLQDSTDLPTIKPDFIINSFDGDYGAIQEKPGLAVDGDGNYICTWIDYRNIKKNIYAQAFNKDGQKVNVNIKLNDNEIGDINHPYITANHKGNFICVWRSQSNNIVIQRLTSSGERIGSNIEISTYIDWSELMITAAVNKTGGFCVVWSSGYGLTAVLFNSNGEIVSPTILVNEYMYPVYGGAKGNYICADDSGNFYVTWSSRTQTGYANIFLQKINPAGEKVGDNIKVNQDDFTINYEPVISSTKDGHILIVWMKEYYVNFHKAAAARIFFENSFLTNEGIFNKGNHNISSVHALSDYDSTFIMLWNINEKTYAQKMNAAGSFINGIIQKNIVYDYDSSSVLIEHISNIVNEELLFTFEASEKTDKNVYVKKLNLKLDPVSDFTKVHDDYGSAWQRNSKGKFNKNGEAIIVWEDERNGTTDLYAQTLDVNFNKVGNNLRINDNNGNVRAIFKTVISSLADGTFIVAFSYGSAENNNSSQVYLQRVSSKGEKIGKNILAKKKSYQPLFDLTLNTNSADEIFICYFDRYSAFLRKFDKELNAASPEINFMQYSFNMGFDPFIVSFDSSNNMLAVWKDITTNTGQGQNIIRGRYFDSNGKAKSDIIIDSSAYNSKFNLKLCGDNFALVFNEAYLNKIKRRYFFNQEYTFDNLFYSDSYPIYDQVDGTLLKFENNKLLMSFNTSAGIKAFFADDNKRVSNQFNIYKYTPDYLLESYNNRWNSIDMFENKILLTFESARLSDTGFDIWAHAKKLDNIDFSKSPFYPPGNSDVLFQNFPNPFNPKTKIVYELLSYHKVNLSVFDILGREVRMLVNENQEKGIYEVEFDASELPSGIYFYRLSAFNTTVKKMMVVK